MSDLVTYYRLERNKIIIIILIGIRLSNFEYIYSTLIEMNLRAIVNCHFRLLGKIMIFY